MLIMRLIHLKDMPSFQSVLDTINRENLEKNNEYVSDKKKINTMEKNEINKIVKDQIKNTSQTKLEIESFEQKNPTNLNKEKIFSFEQLIDLASKKREVELKYDLERNVNLIRFSEGKIDIGFNENLNKNFVRNLSEKLLVWTGQRWIISLTKEKGKESFLETKNLKKKELLENEKKNETYKKIKNTFPDAELIEVNNKTED